MSEKEGQKEKEEKTKHQKEAVSVTQAGSNSKSSVIIGIADHALFASKPDEQCTWIIDVASC